MAEEFNKYLSYVRNLGFEDTPDYDYLRDLFTQALKNTGEVEDGEYDWMKLNNGKGWEAIKQHPSQHHLHAVNPPLNPSARALAGGGGETPRGTGTAQVTRDRLNAAQPLPPSPAKPGVGKTRDRLGGSGAQLPKRASGAAGGLTDLGTPAASTQAQFQNSSANLPQRMSHLNHTSSNQVTATATKPNGAEQPPTFSQKIMKFLCCGSR